MDARKYDVLTLTNTNGSIAHVDQRGRILTAIDIGHLTDVCIHLFGVNGHTVKVWGTNESEAASEANAVQLGVDIVADALVVLEDGPMTIFIEVDAAGTGQPTLILTGRLWTH